MTTTASGPVLIGTFTEGSDDWHAARAHGLGGSEIAPVLGISPYESRFSLWHRKAGGIGPVEESAEMEWGKRLEPAVTAKFADLHPEWALTQPGTWHAADRPWQIANPDRLLTGDDGAQALLEIKTARYSDGWGDEGTDEIPAHYRTQCLWYLDVFGLDVCHVAVLISGSDYREYQITYDPTEAEELRQAAAGFLDDLENGVRPDIDEHDATYQALRELHPDIDGTDIELDVDLVARAAFVKSEAAKAKAAETQVRSLIADAMGTAKRARYGDLTVADRRARNGGTPYVQLGRSLPTPDDLTTTTTEEQF